MVRNNVNEYYTENKPKRPQLNIINRNLVNKYYVENKPMCLHW